MGEFLVQEMLLCVIENQVIVCATTQMPQGMARIEGAFDDLRLDGFRSGPGQGICFCRAVERGSLLEKSRDIFAAIGAQYRFFVGKNAVQSRVFRFGERLVVQLGKLQTVAQIVPLVLSKQVPADGQSNAFAFTVLADGGIDFLEVILRLGSLVVVEIDGLVSYMHLCLAGPNDFRVSAVGRDFFRALF